MSYLKKTEYEIILKESFGIIHSCPRCSKKTHFKNTEKFRINANSNKLDIWLIYQCEECKHTLNLAIYERIKVSSISKEEYQRFLDNDTQLARTYGKSTQLFFKNKADIDFGRLHYEFVKRHEAIESSHFGGRRIVTITNPHQLKIRPEKQIAGVLGLSRSQVRGLLLKGNIELKAALPQLISIEITGEV
ncbi:DUF1062 domain-containing protein [Parablautia intestinalis]|uniref:DUF1062 domain-containing protein n=1 Tax=Parablautia intestinalis TaxID=2320100 RepID=UPI00256EBF51|nr:DUF1062 domain-containing protein [Parablautia intestinalis]MCI8614205.1 DUF1062 domain-containing protein [Lachnospiraceae bacterium]